MISYFSWFLDYAMPRRKRSSVDSSLEDEIAPAKRSRKRGTEGEVVASFALYIFEKVTF